MTTLTEKVSDAINRAIEADRLVLPTMPEMALRVREVAEDPDASIKQLTTVIGADTGLTARLIKVANSALYRGANEIQDLNMALMRLGMATTSSLAMGLAMEQMFQATSDMVDRRLRKVWSASTEIAGMSTILCKHCTNLRPDQATLAGLTHQIGVLPILAYAEEHPMLLKDSITLDVIIRAAHPQIGAKILSTWDFPKEICNVPLEYQNFTRKALKADYADIVTVATLQVAPQMYEDLDYQTVTAFARLGLEADIENAEAQELTEVLSEGLNLFN